MIARQIRYTTNQWSTISRNLQSSKHVHQLLDEIPRSNPTSFYPLNLPLDAFRRFKLLLKSGQLNAIDEVTLALILKGSCRNSKQGTQVHKFAITSGLMGERVADTLMEMEPNESGPYVLMSNLYAEKGKWEKVAKLRKMMRQRGVRKEVGFSWVDVGDINSSMSLHGFSSGDGSHPQSDEICKMAEYLGLHMKLLREKNRLKIHSNDNDNMT